MDGIDRYEAERIARDAAKEVVKEVASDLELTIDRNKEDLERRCERLERELAEAKGRIAQLEEGGD